MLGAQPSGAGFLNSRRCRIAGVGMAANERAAKRPNSRTLGLADPEFEVDRLFITAQLVRGGGY